MKKQIQRLRVNAAGDERGEGVISLAIGVLIMAFLGAGMWVAFNTTMHTTQNKVDNQVQTIGD
jgi:hypothetical protein